MYSLMFQMKRSSMTKKKLTLKFVKEHRTEIDACINKFCPGIFGRLNDNVRYDWIRSVLPEAKCYDNIECNQICKELNSIKGN